MLKVGKVYFDSKTKNYFYVASLTQKDRKLNYVLHRITLVGRLAERKLVPKSSIKKGQTRYELDAKIKVEVTVKLKRVHREHIQWRTIVNEARKEVKLIISSKSKYLKEKHKTTLAKIAYCSVGHYLEKEGRDSNLRDFAKAVGFKKPSKLYNIIADYLDAVLRPTKYSRSLPNASDISIIDAIKCYSSNWQLIHGFNKRIDAKIERDLKGYTKEVNKRSLKI
jgi:hypothetical protein